MTDIHQILQQYWGYTQFRPLQEAIIQSVLAGNDTLALLPTGGGKSVCFQVPALALPDLCLVVSPLIALMKDQVFNLRRHGIKAEAIHTGISRTETERILDNCRLQKVKFLYLSPERLQTESFRQQLQRMKVSLVAVDEAHCISQWGYDFRPAYLQIAQLRPLLPQVPMIALTATATPQVQTDIRRQLLFAEHSPVFTQSFRRSNLSYSVFNTDNKPQRLIQILENVKGSGVVYVRNRRKTKEIAELLTQHRIKADYYHAGLTPQQRSAKQDNWVKNATRIMVCTNAFGMGIDKPDVRSVVHIDLPESLEAYYQEAGRAGRDGNKAYAVVLYDQTDLSTIRKSVVDKYPPTDTIKQIYQAIANYCKVATEAGEGQTFVFDIGHFCKNYQLKPIEVQHSLAILQQNNYLLANDALQDGSKLLFTANREEIYRLEVANQRLEPYIKTILRTYGGVFDDYVTIRENDIARHLKMPADYVKNALLYLQKMGAVDYQPTLSEPCITFLQARPPADRLLLDTQLLAQRQQIHSEQVSAVENYVYNSHICRTQQLVRYFGESDAGNCGVCDVCVNHKKQQQSNIEQTLQIQHHIMQLVHAEKLTVDLLVRKLNTHHPDEVLRTLRWLLETEQLYTNKDKKLVLATTE